MPDRLFELAAQERIKIEYWEFAPPLLAVYTCLEGMPPVIGLDVSLSQNPRSLRCILAEELGHHFTTAGYATPRTYFHYANRLLLSKSEDQALRWAANYLIPATALRHAIDKGIQKEELADHFNVTKQLLRFRLKLLKQEG
ncbi:ImmA/IrrE family metallo-endopeptidase [Desulforamulus reducens]|nr:ImmA/IrrE family metallo-endopeptidase [Desulforamulus reducens]